MVYALFDVVTPELRAVVIDLVGNVYYMRFYYEGDVEEDLIELWNCALTESSADMGPDCITDEAIERLDAPQDIPIRGGLAYLRKEHDVSHVDKKEVLSFEWGRNLVLEQLKRDAFIFATEGLKSYGAALLAGQHALLGVVTPELRSVTVDIDNASFNMRMYYDGQVDQTQIEEWERAIEHAWKLIGEEYVLDGKVERLDFPQEIPVQGRLIYQRLETIP